MRYALWVVGLLIILLLIRFFTFYSNKPSFKTGQEIRLETTLLSEPRATGNTQSFYINNILVITSRFPEYHYGDKLIIFGTLEERVIDNKRIILTIYFPKIENHSTSSWLALANFIRQKIITVFKDSLPSNEASLLLGIVFGIKENLDSDLFNNLRASGTLHVVAASGMNVSIVGSFLSSFLALLVRRQIAFALSILGIFFYALLAGLEPSIVRACLMGAISYSALILGRQNLAILSLFVSAYVMLFATPTTLFDIGFQLSFMATLGLIIFKPVLGNLGILKKISRLQVGNDLTTTVSAQLFTLPIILSNFGNYSPLSVAANTLVLWTIAPLMIIGGIGSILAPVLSILAKLVLIIALPLLLIFEKVVSVFAKFGEFKINEFSFLIYLGYYLILFSIVIFFYRKNA